MKVTVSCSTNLQLLYECIDHKIALLGRAEWLWQWEKNMQELVMKFRNSLCSLNLPSICCVSLFCFGPIVSLCFLMCCDLILLFFYLRLFFNVMIRTRHSVPLIAKWLQHDFGSSQRPLFHVIPLSFSPISCLPFHCHCPINTKKHGLENHGKCLSLHKPKLSQLGGCLLPLINNSHYGLQILLNSVIGFR